MAVQHDVISVGDFCVLAFLDFAELVLRLPAPVPGVFKRRDLRVRLVTLRRLE